MDRYQELIAKRDREGLTDDEADELGRLMAERRGQPYEGNAQEPPPDVAVEQAGTPQGTAEEAHEAEQARGGREAPTG
jgi:hypothetical protein